MQPRTDRSGATASARTGAAAPPPWRLLEHELRGTVGAIAGLVRLLAEGRVPEPERVRVMASLQNAANRASRIANDVGQLARWSRATGEPREPVPLVTLLERAIGWEPDARALTLDAESCADCYVPVIESDAVVIAFAALARASRRAAVDGVGCRARENGETVEVLFGPVAAGWPAEAEQQPFDTTRGGLGLSVLLAAAIVEAHGGRLFQDASGAFIGVCLPLTATT